MLKRSLVMGSLIAGAFLLPSLASAGKVSGPCVNCHTMHNSQDGLVVAAGGPYATLLSGASCAGCHAIGVNDATGKKVDGAMAPQVIDKTDFVLSGGFFDTTAGTAAHQHNPSNITGLPADVALGNTPPGGSVMAAQLTCQDCHDGSGGHHGTTGGFRLLGAAVTGTPAGSYGARAVAPGDIIGARDVNEYTTTMNVKCGSCHTLFHTNGNQETSVGSGSWLRHPTDIQVVNSPAYPSIIGLNAATDTRYVPVGSDGTNTNMVLCLSCHVAHGSEYNDLLSFQYGGSGSYAGDNTAAGNITTANSGCETCHGYGGTGM